MQLHSNGRDGLWNLCHEGADPSDDQEDAGIILEGVTVLELRNVPFAVVVLLALVYSLNLSYPPELKYTFEALQKIIMELDGNKLSAKVQGLKTLFPVSHLSRDKHLHLLSDGFIELFLTILCNKKLSSLHS